MKKFPYLILACLLLTACEIETSSNGSLDGNWQLRQIDTLATGGTCDMSRSYIYWGIEGDLLQVRDIDNAQLKLLFRFEKQGDSLRIFSPYQAVTKDDLQPVESDSLLLPLGIADVQERYLIQQLSGSHLTLQGTLYRLWFRKY